MAETAPSSADPLGEHHTARWLAVLDALEQSLEHADRLLADPTAAVTEGSGPAAATGGAPTGGAAPAGAPAPGTSGAGATGQPWSPPTGLGPLPSYLTGRVQRLIARQRATAALLEAARGNTARHLATLRAVRSGAGSAGPAYVDVTG